MEYIDNGAGIYFDPVGKARIISQKLHLQIFTDLSFIPEQKEDMLTKLVKAENFCKIVMVIESENLCLDIIRNMKSTLEDSTSRHNSILQSLEVKRFSRSVETINSSLQDLAENQQSYQNELNDKIVRLESLLNKLSDKTDHIEKSEKKLNTKLKTMSDILSREQNCSSNDFNQLKNYGIKLTSLAKWSNETNETLQNFGNILRENNETLMAFKGIFDNLKINDELTLLLMATESNIRTFRKKLDDILLTIQLSRGNVLNTVIVSHDQIFDELSKNVNFLASNEELLYHLQLSNMQLLIDSSEVVTFGEGDSMINELRIPLVNKRRYLVYQPLPFPIVQNRLKPDMYVYIEPSTTKHLGVSTDTANYVYLDFDKCLKFTKEQRLCQVPRSYSVGSKPTCEVKLLTGVVSTLPEECRVKYLYGYVDLWLQTRNNRWIFAQSEKTPMTINCKGQHPIEDDIVGSGILDLPSNCTVQTSTSTLPRSGYSPSSIKPPVTVFNLKDDDCCSYSRIEKLKEKLKPNRIVVSDVESLEEYAYDLTNVGQNGQLAIVMYVFLTVLAMLLVFVVYKVAVRFRNRDRTSVDQIDPDNLTNEKLIVVRSK